MNKAETTKITEAALYGLLMDVISKNDSSNAATHVARTLQEIGVKTIGRTNSATWTKEIPKENIDMYTAELEKCVELIQSVNSLIKMTVKDNKPLPQNADVLVSGNL